MTRPKLSPSPLARPVIPIHVLAAKVQEYIYFPSPDPLYVTLGTVVANMMKGNPVWTLLVGPPASGRTILLDTMRGLSRVHFISMIKSPAALLSGVSKKDVAKGATGGLLIEIGTRGMLVMKDFTSMLSLPRDPLVETLGAFREIYDGHWARALGTDGGRVVRWDGKIGLLSATTPVIDRYSAVIGELGERWMYYRYDKTDGFGESRKAMNTQDPERAMGEMGGLMAGFMEEMGLEWEEGGLEKRALTDVESNRLFALASFTVAARSPVSRDGHTKEIIDISHREVPTRLSSSLGQLYLGLEMLGLGESERWRIICKVSADSMPVLRARYIEGVRNKGMKANDLREFLQVAAGTVRRTGEDLEVHGVIEKVGKGDRMGDDMNSFRLTQWARQQLNIGWGKQ